MEPIGWKLFEIPGVEQVPVLLDPEDKCYFARDYQARGGYQASPTNQLISNFKKTTDKRSKPAEWYHKERAIAQFAVELSHLIPNDLGFSVASIPTSLCKNDPTYDDRFEQTFAKLRLIRPQLKIEAPLSRTASAVPCHRGGQRTVAALYGAYQWDGFSEIPGCLLLVDDVIAAGTAYRACIKHIRNHHPALQVYGVFWARSIHPDPPPPEPEGFNF